VLKSVTDRGVFSKCNVMQWSEEKFRWQADDNPSFPFTNAGMFIKPCYKKSNGKKLAYWGLVESYRTAKGPRRRIVAYLVSVFFNAIGGLSKIDGSLSFLYVSQRVQGNVF